VLGGLDAVFRAGRMTAVVGRSGSGKSTLVHLLAGLERPTAGSVVVAGVDLAGLDRRGLAAHRRAHVGLVTQEPGLTGTLTATENVELGLALRRAPGDRIAHARAALREVGLEHRLDGRAATLSAGERQRVAIARALAAAPALLLLDEPTARIDEESARAAVRLLLGLARARGIAVVCATHDPIAVEAADDAIAL
jgi:putative ABC transport system ATP-binding protein